jgi:hypothetical protein
VKIISRKTAEEIDALLLVAMDASSKIRVSYGRGEIGRCSELDDLVGAIDRLRAARRCLR